MAYQIEFKNSVLRDLKGFDKKIIERIFKKISTLGKNPYQANIEKLNHVESYFRARISDYRIVFQIFDNEKKIIIHYIRHRREVYRNL